MLNHICLLIIPRRRSRYVARVISGICDCVCVCVSVRAIKERKATSAINAKLGTRILNGSRTACVDPEVRRSKVKLMKCAACVGMHVGRTAEVSSCEVHF